MLEQPSGLGLAIWCEAPGSHQPIRRQPPGSSRGQQAGTYPEQARI
jgi:hypothetical protein